MEDGERLSEMIGVFLGDGCFHIKKNNSYFIFISMDKKDKEYTKYLKNLFLELYPNEKFVIYECPDQVRLINRSKKFGNDIIKKGIIPGDKVKNKVKFPIWIWKNKKYVTGVLRGLFDTDGCIYRKYENYLQIQYKFANYDLLDDSRKALINLGFTPTKIQKEVNKKNIAWKFYLCKQKEIDRFMNKIKPKNPKHFERYFKVRGGIAQSGRVTGSS